MHCQFCNQEFASKYTLRRHIQRKHKNMNETEMDDSMSDASDNDDSSSKTTNDSISEDSLSDVSTDNEDQTNEDSENVEEEDDDEEENFWTLMIRETVNFICHKRLADGSPAHIATDVSQLLEGNGLKYFIKKLKERHDEIREISCKMEYDDLLELLWTKSNTLSEKVPSDTSSADCEEAIWKKYKFLIKKKIVENKEELKPLVESEDESGDEEPNELEE